MKKMKKSEDRYLIPFRRNQLKKVFTISKVMKLKAGVIVALHLRISYVLHEMAESVLSFSSVILIPSVQKLKSGDKQRCRP